MQAILSRPGIQKGATAIRLLKLYAQSKFYRHEPHLVMSLLTTSSAASSFNPQRLSDFGFACYLGEIEWIQTVSNGLYDFMSSHKRLACQAFEKGDAPPMANTETCFQWGYLTLAVVGSQELSVAGNRKQNAPLR